MFRIILTLLLVATCCGDVNAIDFSRLDRNLRKAPTWSAARQDYWLLVLTTDLKERIWVVRDGVDLYVDHNGNGDLTEPAECYEGACRSQLESKAHDRYRIEFAPQTPTAKSRTSMIQLWSHGYLPESGMLIAAQIDAAHYSTRRNCQAGHTPADACVVFVDFPPLIYTLKTAVSDFESRSLQEVGFTPATDRKFRVSFAWPGHAGVITLHRNVKALRKQLDTAKFELRFEFRNADGELIVQKQHRPFSHEP